MSPIQTSKEAFAPKVGQYDNYSDEERNEYGLSLTHTGTT